MFFPTYFVAVCLASNFYNESFHESRDIYPDLKFFVKRQSRGQSLLQPDMSGTLRTSSSLIREHKPISSLPVGDRKALEAASLFFSKEGILLVDAMKRFNVPLKHTQGSAGSHEQHSGMHHTSPEVEPFSEGVLRHSRINRPKGYDSNVQTAARHAERLLKTGTVRDAKMALEKGKAKIQERNQRKNEELTHWRNISSTDPSQARQMTTRVPRRLSRAQYVPLRAHQLHHLGKAENMDIATQMAKHEAQEDLFRKKISILDESVERKLQDKLFKVDRDQLCMC